MRKWRKFHKTVGKFETYEESKAKNVALLLDLVRQVQLVSMKRCYGIKSQSLAA